MSSPAPPRDLGCRPNPGSHRAVAERVRGLISAVVPVPGGCPWDKDGPLDRFLRGWASQGAPASVRLFHSRPIPRRFAHSKINTLKGGTAEEGRGLSQTPQRPSPWSGHPGDPWKHRAPTPAFPSSVQRDVESLPPSADALACTFGRETLSAHISEGFRGVLPPFSKEAEAFCGRGGRSVLSFTDSIIHVVVK